MTINIIGRKISFGGDDFDSAAVADQNDQSDSAVGAVVAAGQLTPSLSSVSPTSFTADANNHTTQLFGSNFVSGDTQTSSSSYTPSTNEVIISGVSIGSGGQTWAGQTVIIPLDDASNPSQFYVKSATDGSLIKVDSTTAEQLYAASIAINDLNSDYDSLGAQYIPSADWAPVISTAETVISEQEGADFLASFLPGISGLLDGDPDAIVGAAETLASAIGSVSANVLELTLTYSILDNATSILNNAYSDYQKFIFDYMPHPADGDTSVAHDQPININTLEAATYNTLLSLNAGYAATDAFSDAANLNTSPWQELLGLVKDAVESAIPGLVGLIEGTTQTIADGIGDAKDVADFEANLNAIVNQAVAVANTSNPFSTTALVNDGSKLSSSIAETQGNALGQGGGSGTVTPTPSIAIVSSPTISENAGRITFTINETGALSQNLTVYVSTLQNWDGSGIYNTSTPGSHVSTNYYYEGLNTIPITFAATSATSSSQSISVAINPLGLTSGSETFGLEVEEANSSGALYEVAAVPFTIVNQASTPSAPTISSVSSSVSSGSVLNAGRSVTFSVTFSAPVTVNQAGGPPFLTLNDNETASYTSGSGTNTLTFVYNVSSGDHTSDLQVTGLAVPNGSRIADLSNDTAVTTGATANTGIQINTAAPTVAITTTGGLTAEATQTISGTVDVADAGTTVTVFDGANNIGSAVVAGNGTWSTNVTLSVTGPNTLVAKDTNSAGNTGVSNQVFFNYDTATYTIAPTNPVALENQGTLTFTLTRANDTSANTVFVQTDENHGSANPNSEYFQEENLIPVFFPQYATTATFSITINDIHAASGSQTFGVSVYPGLSTSGGALASTTFTIHDNDTNTGPITGTIITNDTVTGTSTVSSPVFIEDNATLTNDGVIDINSSGSIGGDNAGGVLSNVAGSVINIDTSDGASRTIDVTRIVNGGTIVASPGAGNVATVAVANGSISDAGSIQALSGTLLLGMFGSSGTANLNASGLSVAASATLQFIGAGTFTLTGNYSNPGSTIVGSSTQIADVVFAAGSNVNLGGNWILDGGSLDLSAATLSGTFSSLTLGTGFDSLNFGSSNLSINDFSSFLTNITDTGTITLSGSIASAATWLGGGTMINDGTFAAPSGWQPAELGNNETFVNNGTVVGGIIIAAGDVIDNEAGAVFDLDSAEAEGGAVINNAGTLDFASEGSGNAQINSVVNNTGTVEFSAATAWGFNGGGSSSASSLLIDPGITLFFAGNASADTFTITGGTFGGGGNVWIISGAKVKFASSTQVDLPLHNDGSLEIAGGTLTVQQALTGSGMVTMDSGTTLALASPQGFTNTISGFSSADTIDLIGTLATDISLNNSDQLVIADAGTAVATLQLAGNYSGTGLAFLLASDGHGGTAITLGVPSPPSVSAGAVVAFTDSATPVPVTLDSSLAVIDRSNAVLTGATVSITSGFQTGDILAATTVGTSIAANYNSSTGILALSGNDSLTDYESVLQSVTFNSTSNAQANGTDPVRTISWTAVNGAGSSAAAGSAAIIADAAPSVAAQGTAAFEVGVSAPVALDPTLTLSDVDNSTLSGATISIGFGYSTGDSLGVTTAGTAITVASNAGGVLTLAGTDTLQDYQKVLRSVTFATTNPTQDDRVITWSVDDGQRSSALAASSVAVNSADDAGPYDFNGDGYDDILLQSASGQIEYANMANGSFQGIVSVTNVPGWNVVGQGNISGGADSAIVIQNGSQLAYVNLVNGGFSSFVSIGNPTGYGVVGVGDIAGDHFADVVIQNPTTDEVGYANMNNGVFNNWFSVADPVGWKAVAVADINDDGHADIVIQNKTTNEVGYANMSNGVLNGFVSLGEPVGYNVVGAGDVNGLGDADVVVQNPTNGSIGYANMINGAVSGWVSIGDPAGWSVIAVEDILGNGYDDIVIENNSNSQIAYANMTGGSFQGWVGITTVPGFTGKTGLGSGSATSGAPELPTSDAATQTSVQTDDLAAANGAAFAGQDAAASNGGTVSGITMLDPGPQDGFAVNGITMQDPGPQNGGAVSGITMQDPGPQNGGAVSSMFDPMTANGGLLSAFGVLNPGTTSAGAVTDSGQNDQGSASWLTAGTLPGGTSVGDNRDLNSSSATAFVVTADSLQHALKPGT